MKAVHTIAWILLVVGGLNWLLIGLGGDTWNVVAMLGSQTLENVIYILVGVSAIVEVIGHKKNCKACDSSSSPSGM